MFVKSERSLGNIFINIVYIYTNILVDFEDLEAGEKENEINCK